MEGTRIGLYYAKLDRTLDLTSYFDSGKSVVVGRHPSHCDLAIPYKRKVNEEVDTVSKRHCRLSFHGVEEISHDSTQPYSPASVCDLGSKNGTYVNGRKLNRGGEAYLSNGDRLGLGSVILELRVEDPKLTQPLSGSTRPLSGDTRQV